MTSEEEAVVDALLDEVKIELSIAFENFPPFRSAHEGVAIVEEEFLEFRDAAYWPHKNISGLDEEEARQLAAMAVRYLFDVCHKGAPR